MARSARQRRGSTAQTCQATKKKRSASGEEVTLLEGDCFEVLAGLEAESVDAIITDPPYGIGFQSARWDSGAIRETAARVGEDRLSPNQAFEVWARLWATECARVLKPGAFLLAFGSPRTFHRLASGIEDGGLELRDTLMWLYGEGMSKSRHYPGGRATTLKPAFEPIVLARRELDGTTEETISRYGTGALNAEACRVQDRHPANVILEHDPDCSEGGCAPGCTAAAVDACVEEGRAHSGSRIAPSRFLYCPKARRGERDAGCERLPQRTLDLFPNGGISGDARNPHPCVKPLELMRWLVRLACPPGGVVLDPTCGSGSTGAASVLEGRRFVGIELERAYLEISAARIAHWAPRGVRKPRIRRTPLGRRR
jgi:DNA modification methylase